MKYTHPDHPHEFTHYDDRALDGLSFAQLNHLMYVDRVMCDPRHEHRSDIELEHMSDDQLRAMLGDGEPLRKRKASPVSLAPAMPREKVKRPLKHDPVPPRYKAQIWWQGKNHSLGWFLTEQVRDEVVDDAKALRAMGLDPRIVQQR